MPQQPLHQKKTPYSPETIEQIRAWVKDCPTWLQARNVIVEKLGIHGDNATRLNRRFKVWVPNGSVPPPSSPPDVKTTDAAGGEFETQVQTSVPKTLDEVLKLTGVDLDTWESKGFMVRRGAKGFAWSARFARKTSTDDIAPLLAAFTKAAAAHAPRKWAVEKANGKAADCLYILNAHDLHLAKLCHPLETGDAPWDIKIAERTYREAIDDLMGKVPRERIEEIIVIIGSDLLQIDNEKSSTSAGTFVDSDSRLAKVFDVATRMLTDVIEQLAARHRVRAIVIPGNHDATTSLFVGKYVEAWFRSHPNVTVDSSPKSRKYYGYGKTLIGFDHGDETRLADLPLLLMRENQGTISRYKYQEVLTGHLHSEGVEEYKGVKVRIAPALCSADRWHSRKGYLGNLRQCQGLLYQREHGLEAIFYSAPLD
jgi:hypothetical protein